MIGLACGQCGSEWVWFVPPPEEPCRWCGGNLEPMALGDSLLARRPERALPVSIDARRAAATLREWVGEVPFAGPELSNTADQLQLCWTARWVAAFDLHTAFEAAIGFDEAPPSRLEGWVPTRWSRRKVPATRWEFRTGVVERRYDDLSLSAHASAGTSTPAAPETWEQPFLSPTATPAELVPAAQAAVRAAVAIDLVAAAGAQRSTDVNLRFAPTEAPRFTLVALPIWVAHYRDEEGGVHALVVDATTGRCAGRRLGSRAVARAYAGRQTATSIAVALFAAFLALAGVIFWLLLPGSMVVGLTALTLVLQGRSAVPSVAAWNRAERQVDGVA